MRLPQGFEWLIIGAIILLLFGAKRLPDAARGLGRSLRIFKAETKNLTGDDSEETTPETVPVATVPVATAVAAPVVTAPVITIDEPALTPAPSVNHRSEA